MEVGPYLKPDFLFVAFSGKENAVFFHRLAVAQANSNNTLHLDFVNIILTSSYAFSIFWILNDKCV